MSNEVASKLSVKARNSLIVIFGIFMIFCVIAPNLKLIASPFTPKIQGKAIDENSGKPIKNMHVLITHEIRYCYVPGNGYVNYKNSVLAKTDENGEFTSNRMLKPMSFTLFGIFDRDYDGTHLITLNNDYEYIATVVKADGNIVLKMKTVSSVQGIHENKKTYEIFEHYSYPGDVKRAIATYKDEASMKLVKYETYNKMEAK